MIADYHVHTPYCGHAHGNLIQYIESAILSGIQEIGFADHLGRYYLTRTQKRRYWDWGMEDRDLARYFSELSDLREIYEGRISIKIGLEIDYIEGAEDLLTPFFDHFPIDFRICSIHCLPRFGWKHLSNYAVNNNALRIYQEYFRLARLALKSNLFNSLAHIDFVWRYIPWPEQEHELILEEITRTLQTAALTGHCIEINANGYLWSQSHQVNGINPFNFLLDQIQRLHVPITIGSDAHDPNMVGKAFPEIIDLLHAKSINTFRCFSDGKAVINSLG